MKKYVKKKDQESLNKLSWLFKTILNYLVFNSFIHCFTFYAVCCEYLRKANIKNYQFIATI